MSQQRRIVINGQYAARRVTGMERFAYELTVELDKIAVEAEGLEMELVVPKKATNVPELRHIRVVRYGQAKGSLWEQIFLAAYCIRHGATSLNLCCVMPVIRPGVICIHDISYRLNAEYCKTLYTRISMWWHRYQYWAAKHFSPLIYTVSEYSKRQMMEVYGIEEKRIVVLGSGCPHFYRIKADETVGSRHPEWVEKPFFFSLGSLAPNKNIEWILAVAKRHPQYNFLIGGNASLKAYGTDYSEEDYKNVMFIGYISDEEVKYLMAHCKAFLFPSFYEGFGLPPLEALSVGAKIVVSNTSCLPETYEDTAYYIDPYNTDINLDELLDGHVSSGEKLLKKYSFARYAKTVVETLSKLP